MPEYKFNLIGKGGYVAGLADSLDAPNDRAAIAHAKRLIEDHDIEIGQAERLVAYLTPYEK